MRGDPEQEARAWLEKLSEVDQERRGYLRLAAKRRTTDEELDEALAELEETRKTAERELETLRSRRKILEELERDRDALLERYARMVPPALDELTTDERHQVYKMLRPRVLAYQDGTLEMIGVFGDSFISENEDEDVSVSEDQVQLSVAGPLVALEEDVALSHQVAQASSSPHTPESWSLRGRPPRSSGGGSGTVRAGPVRAGVQGFHS